MCKFQGIFDLFSLIWKVLIENLAESTSWPFSWPFLIVFAHLNLAFYVIFCILYFVMDFKPLSSSGIGRSILGEKLCRVLYPDNHMLTSLNVIIN